MIIIIIYAYTHIHVFPQITCPFIRLRVLARAVILCVCVCVNGQNKNIAKLSVDKLKYGHDISTSCPRRSARSFRRQIARNTTNAHWRSCTCVAPRNNSWCHTHAPKGLSMQRLRQCIVGNVEVLENGTAFTAKQITQRVIK